MPKSIPLQKLNAEEHARLCGCKLSAPVCDFYDDLGFKGYTNPTKLTKPKPTSEALLEQFKWKTKIGLKIYLIGFFSGFFAAAAACLLAHFLNSR